MRISFTGSGFEKDSNPDSQDLLWILRPLNMKVKRRQFGNIPILSERGFSFPESFSA